VVETSLSWQSAPRAISNTRAGLLLTSQKRKLIWSESDDLEAIACAIRACERYRDVRIRRNQHGSDLPTRHVESRCRCFVSDCRRS
jgi:hypothetical protein